MGIDPKVPESVAAGSGSTQVQLSQLLGYVLLVLLKLDSSSVAHDSL